MKAVSRAMNRLLGLSGGRAFGRTFDCAGERVAPSSRSLAASVKAAGQSAL